MKHVDIFSAVVPNDEVYNRMRQQRVLREELREKKRVLENMMRKDTATRRQYQRNQDIQSDNVSYSNRSDTGGGYVCITCFFAVCLSAIINP